MIPSASVVERRTDLARHYALVDRACKSRPFGRLLHVRCAGGADLKRRAIATSPPWRGSTLPEICRGSMASGEWRQDLELDEEVSHVPVVGVAKNEAALVYLAD